MSALSSNPSKVLSIQSHVVSGYVGNKSAAFPLQVLGFEVDTINSVQFSNHKGYPVCKGQILDSEQLAELYDGLKENNLASNYSHLLTGFIGSQSFLLKVKEVVQDLKAKNPNLIYVCDPVMGDNKCMMHRGTAGTLGSERPGARYTQYVPKELLPIYQQHIMPLADIITPNQFEAELLSGIEITSLETAQQAMHKLHELGAKTVVISSSDLGSDDILVGLGSSVANGSVCRLRMDMPKLPAHFTGTGDLFTALLLAWLHHHPDSLKLACEKTVSCMQHVLRRTLKTAQELAGEGNKPTLSHRELKLIQSKKDIEDPEICVRVKLL